ncbi:conserved hypothetical protein [Ricinus communis]|uniref:Uncharacterized protein n=1 Tax=Ricinus communis TaxID=3988 RepID=B9RPP4_RICCO|nr:conserved hypothetical protein [Ricinus communis]
MLSIIQSTIGGLGGKIRLYNKKQTVWAVPSVEGGRGLRQLKMQRHGSNIASKSQAVAPQVSTTRLQDHI